MNGWLRRQPAPIRAAVAIGVLAWPYLAVALVEHWETVRTWLGR